MRRDIKLALTVAKLTGQRVFLQERWRHRLQSGRIVLNEDDYRALVDTLEEVAQDIVSTLDDEEPIDLSRYTK